MKINRKINVLNETKLESIEQLDRLIDIDLSGHVLKEMASLLLRAMNDWDTSNQARILDFVDEFESYFGIPISKEKIKSRIMDSTGSDAWKHESASSIIELIKLGELHFGQSDIRESVDLILKHYQKMLKKIDFIALLKYKTPEEGGRTTVVFSKYRPQVKFPFDEMQTSGEQTFLNKEYVYPGEEVEASIRILGVEYFIGKLEVNMTFDFREGPIIIGTGKIVQIMNERLRRTQL